MVDKIKVIINNDQKEIRIPTGLRMIVRRACIAVLKLENFEGSAQVSVTLVDNEKIRELNKKYRNVDNVTDVLSFPTGENGNYDKDPATGAFMLGDIIISMPKAVEQAEKHNNPMIQEVGFLAAHSMLHLLGYDHEDALDRMKMREKENTLLSQLGFHFFSGYDY